MDENKEQERDANTMIGAGVGVGALGAGAALITGAVCPLCYIVPPVLVAAGVVQKMRARKNAKEEVQAEEKKS